MNTAPQTHTPIRPGWPHKRRTMQLQVALPEPDRTSMERLLCLMGGAAAVRLRDSRQIPVLNADELVLIAWLFALDLDCITPCEELSYYVFEFHNNTNLPDDPMTLASQLREALAADGFHTMRVTVPEGVELLAPLDHTRLLESHRDFVSCVRRMVPGNLAVHIDRRVTLPVYGALLSPHGRQQGLSKILDDAVPPQSPAAMVDVWRLRLGEEEMARMRRRRGPYLPDEREMTE